jgi:hypothetical protein
MRDESHVPIEEVAIDAGGTIAVTPRIPSHEHFEHIYRAAMGVRWQPTLRALVPYETKDATPDWWFRQIVSAVRSEYGQILELRPETKWTNVSLELKRAIQSGMDGHAV